MKPRNFPQRKQRRQILAKWRAGLTMSDDEWNLLTWPKDIRYRGNKRPR